MVCSALEGDQVLQLVRRSIKPQGLDPCIDELQVLGELCGLGPDEFRNMTFTEWYD